MRVTLQDIADRAQVSVNTVSRALNGKPDVNKDTREYIEAIARELNYTPNVHARALVSGNSKTIGLIITDCANPWYAKLIRGVEDTASARGFGAILCNTNEDCDRETRAVQMLREKRVDGMLITTCQSDSSSLRTLQRDDIPFVLLNRHFEDVVTDYVINDNRQGAHDVTAHLAGLGHRRILHITGSMQISSVRERLAGYRQALEELDIPFDPNLVVHCDLSLEGGRQQAELAMTTLSPRPTAIFAYSDFTAIGALGALRELGLRVPQDVALVGYDDVEFAPFVEPPLTTVAQPTYEIGKKGTEILLDKIDTHDEKEWVVHQLVFKPELKVRASSGGRLEPKTSQ